MGKEVKAKSTTAPKRKTPNYLTKYERARILGMRSSQIALGAPVMVIPPANEMDPLKIALQELEVQPACYLY